MRKKFVSYKQKQTNNRKSIAIIVTNNSYDNKNSKSSLQYANIWNSWLNESREDNLDICVFIQGNNSNIGILNDSIRFIDTCKYCHMIQIYMHMLSYIINCENEYFDGFIFTSCDAIPIISTKELESVLYENNCFQSRMKLIEYYNPNECYHGIHYDVITMKELKVIDKRDMILSYKQVILLIGLKESLGNDLTHWWKQDECMHPELVSRNECILFE